MAGQMSTEMVLDALVQATATRFGHCTGTIFYTQPSIQFIFFFSSRRRHTRCLSEWSSDVCSSDPSRRRHTRCLSDWSSDVCSSDHLGISYAVFCLDRKSVV